MDSNCLNFENGPGTYKHSKHRTLINPFDSDSDSDESWKMNRDESPDIFQDSSDEEFKIAFDSKNTGILMDLKNMMKKEYDGNNLFILENIKKYLTTNSTCTVRELYYKCPVETDYDSFHRKVYRISKRFKSLPCQLGINSTSRGLIAGNIKITLGSKDVIKCNTDGQNIPIYMKNMEIQTNAKMVLIVEKETVFQKLLEQKIFQKFGDIILITGRGYPDINTRLMLKTILEKHPVDCYCFVDGNPFGIDIMSVYRFGSKSYSYVKDQLSCPSIRWLGIHPSEIVKLKIFQNPFNEFDMRCLKKLLNNAGISEICYNELRLFEHIKVKSDIEFLSLEPCNFFLRDYIFEKIRHKLYY